MGQRESATRKRLYELFGTAYLQGVHYTPREVLKDPEEEDMTDVPDFLAILKPGALVEERREQFLFETDEDGNWITDEEGDRVPLGQLALRKWAAKSEDCPTPDEHRCTIQLWDFDKILKYVLQWEKNIGRIAGSGRRSGKAKAKQATTTVDKTPKKVKETMATAKRSPITLRRGPKGIRPAETEETEGDEGEAEDHTPAKVKAASKVTKAATGKKRRGKKAPTKSSNDPEDANDQVSAGISEEEVRTIVKNELAPVMDRLESICDSLEGHRGRTLVQTVLDANTLVVDLLTKKLNIDLLEQDEDEAEKECLFAQKEPTDLLTYYIDGPDEGN